MSGQHFRGYGSKSYKMPIPYDNYSTQLLQLMKRQMHKIDHENAKRINAYKTNSKQMSEKHSRLLNDVQSNLSKFKDEYDGVKRNFQTERESSAALRRELSQALTTQKQLQARYDDLVQKTTVEARIKQKEKTESKNKEQVTSSASKKRKIDKLFQFLP